MSWNYGGGPGYWGGNYGGNFGPRGPRPPYWGPPGFNGPPMGYGPNRFPYGYAPPPGFGPPRFPGNNFGGNNFCADEPGVPGEDQPQQPPMPPGEGQDQGEQGGEANGQSQPPQPLMHNQGWNQPHPNNFYMGQRMPGFNPVPPQVSGKKKKKKNKQAQQQEQKLAAQASNCPDSIPLPTEQQNQQPSTSNNANKSVAGMMPSANDWPESLKNYVARCFGKCKNDLDKDQVEIILKGKITTAATNETLWSKDWDSEPLPVTLLASPSVSNASSTKSPASKRGKFSFPMKGGRGGFGRHNRFNDGDSSSDESSTPSKSRKKSKNQPNYGDNPNKIPLGNGKQKKGLGKSKLFGQVPYFYTDGSSKSRMTLDKDLATNERKQKRAARFERDKRPAKSSAPLNLMASLNSQLLDFEETTLQWEGLHLVGTCTDLEKRFFRLTSAPEVSQIRPLEVLKKSLELVVKKWKQAQDYHYACDQLKSIRQDLTVSYNLHYELCIKKCSLYYNAFVTNFSGSGHT